MKTNLDLYGRDDVPRVPAILANFRISLLKENLEVLMSKPFMEQDTSLINEVLKAITFWEKLRDGETL